MFYSDGFEVGKIRYPNLMKKKKEKKKRYMYSTPLKFENYLVSFRMILLYEPLPNSSTRLQYSRYLLH